MHGCSPTNIFLSPQIKGLELVLAKAVDVLVAGVVLRMEVDLVLDDSDLLRLTRLFQLYCFLFKQPDLLLTRPHHSIYIPVYVR